MLRGTTALVASGPVPPLRERFAESPAGGRSDDRRRGSESGVTARLVPVSGAAASPASAQRATTLASPEAALATATRTTCLPAAASRHAARNSVAVVNR